jgi:hypothetical protein
MGDELKTDQERIEALEAAVLALHERLVDVEACYQRALSCLKLTAQVHEGLQRQIEALTGAPKPATPKPGGPMLQ